MANPAQVSIEITFDDSAITQAIRNARRAQAAARAARQVRGGRVASGMPGLGGYGYGDPNPYTGAPHIGVDIEVGANTRLYLPSGCSVASAGVNGAIGHFLLLRAPGGFCWLGHLNQLVRHNVAVGDPIGLTGSPESSGGFGHGAHLYMAYTRGTSLSWGSSMNPVPLYNRIGRELFGLQSHHNGRGIR